MDAFIYFEGLQVEGYCTGDEDVVLIGYEKSDTCLAGETPWFMLEQKVGMGMGYWGDAAEVCKPLRQDSYGEDDNLMYNPNGVFHHKLECGQEAGLTYTVYESKGKCEDGDSEGEIVQKVWEGSGKGKCKQFTYDDGDMLGAGVRKPVSSCWMMGVLVMAVAYLLN